MSDPLKSLHLHLPQRKQASFVQNLRVNECTMYVNDIVLIFSEFFSKIKLNQLCGASSEASKFAIDLNHKITEATATQLWPNATTLQCNADCP